MGFSAIAGLVGGAATQAIGGEAKSSATVGGAQLQAAQERLGQEFQREQFEAGLERQRPFLEAGQAASPLLTLALRNELEGSNLPGAEIQKSLVAAGLEDAPEFVRERTGRGIEAIDAENQKSRLLELVQIGLGAAGSASGTRANIGTTTAQSLGRIGNIQSQALQSAAIQRQNQATGAADFFGGLPAFLASQQRRPQGGGGQPLTGGFAQTNTGQFVPVA